MWSARIIFAALVAALGADGFAADDPAVVSLPPFFVEEIAKGPPWRYGEAMGYEILSRCDDAVTRKVVDAHQQLHVLLAEILPPQLRLRQSVPKILLLYDQELQPAASKEVIARMLRDAPDAVNDEDLAPALGGARIRVAAPRRITFLPNLRVWDLDSMAVFMIVRRDDFDPERLALTYDYVGYLVRGRVPTLPLWFISGFLAMYQQTGYDGGRLTVKPMEWLSAAHVARLRNDPKLMPVVQPLPDFFAGKFPSSDPAMPVDPFRAWLAHAELLVRWGLDPRGGGRREAFWTFVERSAAEGVSEALFHELLGLNFDAARVQLAAYVRPAMQRALEFEPERKPRFPRLALRNATDGEVARIKGDLERLEVPYVKGISPELVPKYREQARRTLQRAYDRDHRDPRLVAILGLCEVDAGNDAAGREYLEEAARLGPIRPRANYELARLRLAEIRAKSAEKEVRLSATQTAHVLSPLFAARANEPPLPQVYELIAEVWAHATATPTRGHLAVLDEGVRFFPRRTELALRAAELNLRHGYRTEAALLTTIAQHAAGDEGSRRRVAALLKQIETSAGRGTDSRPPSGR